MTVGKKNRDDDRKAPPPPKNNRKPPKPSTVQGITRTCSCGFSVTADSSAIAAAILGSHKAEQGH